MLSKAKRDAANVASARQSTSGSARGVKTAGGTKRKRSSNMASEAERVAANDSGPSNSGSAMSVRTPGGTELDFNDPWTARILVTAIAGVGMYLAHGFVTFLHNYPELVRYAVKVVFRPYGEVEDIELNSITVDLACGSKKKFLKFKKDFEDGKVKVALERELKEIGCDPKLELKLELKLVKETPNVVAVEVSKKIMKEETRKILFANPNPEDEEEKESDQEAEVEENPEGADNPDKEDIQPPSLKREKASGSTEVKQERKSGSAAKKPKLDPIREPGTSEVSNTSETGKFKEGVVSNDDLQKLGKAIGENWDQLARRVPGIEEDDIEEIEERYRTLPKRGYQILRRWKSKNTNTADYKTLYNALDHELVGRKDLAQKYCLK